MNSCPRLIRPPRSRVPANPTRGGGQPGPVESPPVPNNRVGLVAGLLIRTETWETVPHENPNGLSLSPLLDIRHGRQGGFQGESGRGRSILIAGRPMIL